MRPEPEILADDYRSAGWLQGKVALVTGGDSGIGRSVAVAFAKEGADVGLVYLDEHDDAKETQALIEAEGRRAVLCAGDVGDEGFCRQAVATVVRELGHLEIVVNNAGEQHPQDSLLDISRAQLERTFRTNIFSMFSITQAALPHLREGASIINTSSLTAYRGSKNLIDYAATKGAIVAFTRSLAESLVESKIRVNAVAPGPIWTPLIPASYGADRVATHGSESPMQQPGQPSQVAPAYVYLASTQSTYVSGQTIHVNGGVVVNG